VWHSPLPLQAAAGRLATLDAELAQLKAKQKDITEKWQAEKQEMNRVQVSEGETGRDQGDWWQGSVGSQQQHASACAVPWFTFCT
jgi:hypothetical protein